MSRTTNDDPASRVQVAKFEAVEWIRSIQFGGWFAGIGSGIVVAALAYFQAPFWLLMGAGTALIILSIAAILNLLGYRLYVQNAFTEMTVAYTESEMLAIRDRLEQTEATVNDIAKWTRPPRTDY